MLTKYELQVGVVVRHIASDAEGVGFDSGAIATNTVANTSKSLRRFCVAEALRE